MWPEIHRETAKSDGDFVPFIQEAFELAEAKKSEGAESPAAGPRAKGA
jgi:hypothetical protein